MVHPVVEAVGASGIRSPTLTGGRENSGGVWLLPLLTAASKPWMVEFVQRSEPTYETSWGRRTDLYQDRHPVGIQHWYRPETSSRDGFRQSCTLINTVLKSQSILSSRAKGTKHGQEFMLILSIPLREEKQGGESENLNW